MKGFNSNKKNVSAASIASKACAWILSIMLVVTGMAPSFAANAKTGKGSAIASVKSVSNIKKPSKTKKDVKDEETSKTKVEKKPDTAKKYVGASSKKQKIPKDNEDKNGKQNRIKNKRGQTFDLNSSGNVYAEFDDEENLTVSAKNASDDMNIEREMWWHMAENLGAGIGENGWNKTRVKNIRFNTNGIYLPKHSECLFKEVKGEISGCEKLNTSKVEDMSYMFREATSANPDVSKWDTSKVIDMSHMFRGAMSAKPDVSKWDTSRATDMSYMFREATSANPDVSKWNVSNVNDFQGMFYAATSANPNVSKWNVLKATDMRWMFRDARLAKPDVSKWNVSNVTDMREIFRSSGIVKLDLSKWKLNWVMLNYYYGKSEEMFKGCSSLETLKTSAGLRTYVSVGDNHSFKIIKLKKGIPASVEKESQNFNEKYEINASGDQEVIYHIYRKDNFVGVTFDKNDGDTESWVNHEIVEKGKAFSAGGGIMPAENPTYAGYVFYGWTKNNSDTAPDFDENTVIVHDMKVYSVWRKPKVNVTFEVNGGSGEMPAMQVEQGSDYVLPACTFTPPADKEFDKWSVTVGTAAPVNKQPGEKITASDNVTVKAIWKDKPIEKVNITFDKTEGEGNMPAVEVVKYSKYKLPESTFTAPAGKEFDKWSVKIGSAPAEDKYPNDEITASDNVTVKAVWKDKPIEKVNITFDKTEGEGNMVAVEVVKDSKYKLPESTFTAPAGKEFDKWSVKIGSAPAEDKYPNDEITASDNVTVKAVWKDTKPAPPAPGKVRITLDGNGGVLAGGAFATIDVDEGSTLKEQLESAVANKIFTKDAYKLIGFSRSKFATTADYNLDAPVYSDMTLYAVYKEAPAVTNVTIKYTEVGMDEDEVIENVPTGKPIGDKLYGHERALAGHRFLGYSKENNAVKPDFFKKSIVTNNLVIYPVYKEIGIVDKVKVAFRLNDGTDASLKTEEVTRYESLGDKMPTKDNVAERDGYLFTGWARSKEAKYPDFFRGTTVKGDMTVYAVWKSLYDEKLGQAVLKVAAKAKGYELTIEPPKANLHTGFEIFRSEKKDFKPSKDNKIATIDRNTLKYLDEKADNGKAYYYAVRAIDADGSYNGTKVTYIGKLSDKVLAASLPKYKGVTATVTGKGAVDLEFNKTIAATKYKVTVTAPYDKKFKTIERFVEADKLLAAAAGKVKAKITGLPMGKFLAFKLEALEADNTKLLEYGNSFAFMMGAVDKLSLKVNKKKRVLNIKFKAMKGASGYEAKIVIKGKVKTIKLKKGKKKLRGFIVGSIKLPKKKGNYTFTIRAFKKIGKLKYFGQAITKTVK